MTPHEAISHLLKVAGELVRCDGIPDHETDEFTPLQRAAVAKVRVGQVRRAKIVADAVKVLRKDEV